MFVKLADEYTSDETNPKFALAYLYDDSEGANFMFRALSAEPVLQDDFVFMAISDPT